MARRYGRNQRRRHRERIAELERQLSYYEPEITLPGEAMPPFMVVNDNIYKTNDRYDSFRVTRKITAVFEEMNDEIYDSLQRLMMGRFPVEYDGHHYRILQMGIDTSQPIDRYFRLDIEMREVA